MKYTRVGNESLRSVALNLTGDADNAEDIAIVNGIEHGCDAPPNDYCWSPGETIDVPDSWLKNASASVIPPGQVNPISTPPNPAKSATSDFLHNPDGSINKMPLLLLLAGIGIIIWLTKGKR